MSFDKPNLMNNTSIGPNRNANRNVNETLNQVSGQTASRVQADGILNNLQQNSHLNSHPNPSSSIRSPSAALTLADTGQHRPPIVDAIPGAYRSTNPSGPSAGATADFVALNLSNDKKQRFLHNKNFSLPSASALNTSNLISSARPSSGGPQTQYLQVTTGSEPPTTHPTRHNTLSHSGSWYDSEQSSKNDFLQLDHALSTNSPKSFKRQCAIDFPVNQLSHSISGTSSTASAVTLAGEASLETKLSSSTTNLPGGPAGLIANQLTIDQTRNEKNKSDTDVNRLQYSANLPLFSTSPSRLAEKHQSPGGHQTQRIKGEPPRTEQISMSSNPDDQQLLKTTQNNSSSYFAFANHRAHQHPSSSAANGNRKDGNHRTGRGPKQPRIHSSSRTNLGTFFARTSNHLLASLTGMKRIKRSIPSVILTPNNSLEEKTSLAEKKRHSTAHLIASSGSNSDVNSDRNSCSSLPMDQPQAAAKAEAVDSCEVINLGSSSGNNAVTTCSSSTNTISQPNQYSSLPDDYRLRFAAAYDHFPPCPPPSASSWYNATVSSSGRPYLQYRQRTDDGELRKRKQEQWLSTKQASIASQALSACEASTGFLSNLLPSGISGPHGRSLHKSFDHAYHPMSTMITSQQLGGHHARTVYHSTGSVPTTNVLSANHNLITVNNQFLKKAGSNGQEIKSRSSLTSEQTRLEKGRKYVARNVLRADTNTTTHSDSLKGAESCSEMSRKHRNSLYELKESARRKLSLIPKVSALLCFVLASFLILRSN